MLPRFHHILVPLDFSQKNLAALDIAFEIAEVNSARVTLLHVIERLEEAAEDQESEVFYARLQQRADAELESRWQRFADAKITAEYRVRFGKRAPEIVHFVRERDVDLIVLSSHPVDEIQPLKSLASVSYQVSLFAPCPVLLVK
ncbi:MAG: universal stress protein [Planctomycetaceae bacterium]|nr:universal stress protein [Planctomycetaceae bacterium]